jgi:DNA repair protein RecO (recombination protein O)
MKYSEFTGFVVGRRNFGEGDIMLNVFSKSLGKLTVVAKGARKPKAKLRSHLEPLLETNFRVINGSNLPIAIGAQQGMNNFFDSDNDVRMSAMMVTEIISLVIAEDQPNLTLYELYKDFLEDCLSTSKLVMLLSYVIFQIMKSIGIEPDLSIQEAGKLVFDIDQGEIKSATPSKTLIGVSENVVKFWRVINQYDKPTVMRLKLERKDSINSLNILCLYIEYHFAKKLKSLKVLEASSSFLQQN